MNYDCPHCGAYDSTRCDMATALELEDRAPTDSELVRMRAVGCRVAHYIDRRTAQERITVPERYTIDVCMTCGRHAVYPFVCGHRTTSTPWTVPITVQPTVASKTVLRAIQQAADDEL